MSKEKKLDVQKLASLLNRVDDHLDKIICTDAARSDDTLSIVTLRLRGEIVAAIGELQAVLNAAVQEQGGDSDVAALQEAAGELQVDTSGPVTVVPGITPPGTQYAIHGNYVGVCGVQDCPHCKTQPAANNTAKEFQSETAHWDGEAKLERLQTWRDRPPLL